MSLGDPFRGVSVHHLCNGFLDAVGRAGLGRDSKVYEIEKDVIRAQGADLICPRDERKGTAYVDAIDGDDEAGRAVFMLSYTWGYTVGDIVDCLLIFCTANKLDPKRTYVWICCLCVNQHRVVEAREKGEKISFEQFSATFGSRVSTIGRILAIMSPFQDPLYVTRVWCDFEIFTAVQKECEVHVLMPPEQEEALAAALAGDSSQIDSLWRVLSRVAVEKAQASVQEDLDNILKLVQAEVGFAKLNNEVARFLRSWIVDTLERHVKNSDAALPGLCAKVGLFMRMTGQLERAESMLELGMASVSAQPTAGKAALLRQLAAVEQDRSHFDQAEKMLEEALEVHKATNTMMTYDAAQVLNSMAILHHSLKNYAKSEEILREAMDVHKAIDPASLRTATAMSNLGNVLDDMKRSEEALEITQRAREIAEASPDNFSPDTASILTNVGKLYHKMQRLTEARCAYESAIAIHDRMGTVGNRQGRVVVRNLRLVEAALLNVQGTSDAPEPEGAMPAARCVQPERLAPVAPLIRRISSSEEPQGVMHKKKKVLEPQGVMHRMKVSEPEGVMHRMKVSEPDGAMSICSVKSSISQPVEDSDSDDDGGSLRGLFISGDDL
eukprot:CAMPEP_0204337370 /NCGR_PEP_ID=MMETSP0469-20131031/20250_1 /ASSEMBLY_ACC=CAM_ASM_000384 /TAXON_ID=2969 /ORGANISM="Oxyrrhis marina" /LENGTH=610 /DNA_ID=CAMNT_0051321389 /DNA_START=8 /DNA_END=1840 /DNA_ORIENTATION=-